MPETENIWKIMKEWPHLVLECLEKAGVARVTLNRPEKRNCLNAPMMSAFFEALEIVRADKELKVIITRGAGTEFSTGLDLHFLRSVQTGEIPTSSSIPPGDWDTPTITTKL